MNDFIGIGDLVQEKEGNRQNGLVLEFRTMNTVGTRGLYEAAFVYWPNGEKLSYKLSFLEKMS